MCPLLSRLPLAVLLAVTLACVSVRAEPAPLSDEAELARATSLYQAGKYLNCAEALARVLGPNSPRPLESPRIVEKARIYQGACWIGAGKPELADEPFREAIRANPQMDPPDGLLFPAPVVERFISVRQSLLGEIRAAEVERIRKARQVAAEAERKERVEQRRVRTLEHLARREVRVTKNSRWLALAPFGVGQFQNREPTLGWIFLTSELALAGAAITSTIVISHLNLEASQTGKLQSPVRVNSQLRDWHSVFVLSSYGFLLLATAGALQAELAFVPEFREIRLRELSPELKARRSSVVLSPTISATRSELCLSVFGRF